MIRVLVAAPRRPCGHDYLADHLVAGLYQILNAAGAGEVALSHPAEHLHLLEDPDRPGSLAPAPGTRDACDIDSDQALPKDLGLSGPPDLILGSVHTLGELRGLACNASCPIAVIDGSDTAEDWHSRASEAAGGRLVRYFKRELPLGATWATPLPFTWPLCRRPARPAIFTPTVVYHTTDHGGEAAARRTIVHQLRAALGEAADVATYPGQRGRPSPEDIQGRLARAMVAVHWNIFADHRAGDTVRGWDANRMWESMAMGCVVVGLRPDIEIPHPPRHGEHVEWVDHAGAVAPTVARLLDDPAETTRRARAARALFEQHHCAEARARYVLRECGVMP